MLSVWHNPQTQTVSTYWKWVTQQSFAPDSNLRLFDMFPYLWWKCKSICFQVSSFKAVVVVLAKYGYFKRGRKEKGRKWWYRRPLVELVFFFFLDCSWAWTRGRTFSLSPQPQHKWLQQTCTRMQHGFLWTFVSSRVNCEERELCKQHVESIWGACGIPWAPLALAQPNVG